MSKSAFLLAWLEQGLPNQSRQRFPLETLASLLSWSLFGASIAWVSEPAQLSQEVMAAQVVDLLVEGLCSALPLALNG